MDLSTDSLWLIGCLPLILAIVLQAIYSERNWEIIFCGVLLACIAVIAAIEALGEDLTYYEHNIRAMQAFGFVLFAGFCFVVSYIKIKYFPPEQN